jgi:RNA ligase (TIGR02306 family)
LNNPDLEAHIFPADAKVKLTKSRIRQIKLRKVASQGMLLSIKDLHDAGFINGAQLIDGDDLQKELRISKYEPPQRGESFQGQAKRNKKHKEHPDFIKYNGINNIKWFPYLFEEGESVTIQEKLHGSLFRASVLPYDADTWWRKLKKFLGLAPEIEKLYGSNRVQISRKFNYKGYYGEDVYGKCAKKYEVFEKLKVGEIAFFELIGPGIQKNYDYGLDDHKIVLYDVCRITDGKKYWLSPDEVKVFAHERGFEMVPVLSQDSFNKETAYSLTFGKSKYNSKQKVREGIVIKSDHNYNKPDGGRKSLKWISEDYLADKDNTDFH